MQHPQIPTIIFPANPIFGNTQQLERPGRAGLNTTPRVQQGTGGGQPRQRASGPSRLPTPSSPFSPILVLFYPPRTTLLVCRPAIPTPNPTTTSSSTTESSQLGSPRTRTSTSHRCISNTNTTPTHPMEPNNPSLTNPPILALIIGINKYPYSDDWPDLSGAVGDANAFEAFLKEKLNVSPSNITNLRDEEASREGILDAFLALRDNAKYKKDEAAITIFYAGHGTEDDPPKEWGDWTTSTGKIEMLCPSDLGARAVTEVDGKQVETVVDAIPDRTISVLLNHISDSRGNNITLIMDCCSSGGISRSLDLYSDMPIENYVARQIKNPPPLRPSGDQNIWARGARGGIVPDGYAGRYYSSHVLLAACGREESARENPKTNRGLFTSSLLKVLESQDLNTLTYTSLMHKLKMPIWQTPHCEGVGVNWRLFNKNASGADPSFILTKRNSKDGISTITMEAGIAQGITVGSHFAVHAMNLLESPLNPRLGELEVKSVNLFSSVMEPLSTAPKFKVPSSCYSKLTYAAEFTMSIFCEDKALLASAFPAGFSKKWSIIVVDDVQQCDLEITVKDGRVHFDRHQQLVTDHLPTRIRHSVSVGDIATIREVVTATRHFYYHLTRTSDDNFKNVWMEMKVLKEEFNRDFDQILTPMGNNLLMKEPATIVVDESVRLGMTIFNQTDLPLYPYLFYFDPTELTIIDWYLTSIGAGAGALTTKVDVPLPPKSSLTIGYGEPGITPWQFLLPEGEKKDLGFFKLFLSTRPAYFDSILQEESPFELQSQTGKRGGKPLGPESLSQEKWGAQLATVIQVDRE
ncbi:unnamed protein product [Cyclocybe aegerita]|uniref:Peptidase C14 caspase domain-containing protein n=1 Tax=Cyclocybe aegerita TaxID=1973307 RepID=A0A8S0VVF6_CYCAE|nr:unnamed protein product [Cyclocybe aegerita]